MISPPQTLKASQAFAKTEEVLKNITKIENVRPLIEKIDRRIYNAIKVGLFEIDEPFSDLGTTDARILELIRKHFTDYGYQIKHRGVDRDETTVYLTWKPEPPPSMNYYDR